MLRSVGCSMSVVGSVVTIAQPLHQSTNISKNLHFRLTLQMLLMSIGNKTIYQNKICKIQ
nr:MAG TPA: hypothetical protein [Caudoviricetes sp.]